MEIIQLLKQYRKDAGFTHQEVADKINVSRNTYTQYENGTRRIDVETFLCIIEALNVQMSLREWSNIEKKIKDVTDMKKEWDNMKNDYLKAIEKYDMEKVQAYIDGGIGGNINSKLNRLAFNTALQYGASEIVRYFLDKGAEYFTYEELTDEYFTDERHMTYAVEMQQYNIVRVFLNWGREPNDEYELDGPSPIQIACKREYYNIVRLLMNHPLTNINATGGNGLIVKELIKNKQDNMLIYIKENYENRLNEEQKEMLNTYLDTYKPENTRKNEHPLQWAWDIYDTKHYDIVQSEMWEYCMREDYSVNELAKRYAKKYRMRPKKLYALVLFMMETKMEPKIPIELKNYSLLHLEKEKYLLNVDIWMKKVEELPVY